MERLVLAAELRARSAWDVVNQVNPESLLSTQACLIHEQITAFYENDPESTSVNQELLLARLERGYPKHYDVLKSVIADAFASDISTVNVKKELIARAIDVVSDKLSAAFGNKNFDEAQDLLSKYHEIREIGFDAVEDSPKEDELEVFHMTPLAQILAATSNANKLQLAPEVLNDHLGGGILRKQHCVIFGRPDAGKTTFLVNLVHGFLNQGLRVLMWENEDNGLVLYKRLLCRITGMSFAEMEDDPRECETRAGDGNLQNFILVASEAGSLTQISNELDREESDILIVDQLRNLHVKADSRVGELEHAARGIRELSKRHNVAAFSVTQAGDSGDNREVLKMGDVDWSNTGIQGACDLMIGLGVTEELANQGYRVLSFPKNKLNGNKLPLRVGFNVHTAEVT